MGLGLGFRALFRAVGDKEFAARLKEALDGPAETDQERSRRLEAERVRLLGLLQRDGRLVDFLTEQIDGYSDQQVGAAVREIHRDCRACLEKYLDLAPVRTEEEETPVEVPAGYDPAATQLTGNVVGEPPFRGTLKHRGWRAAAVRIPGPSEADGAILAPAEVEIS